MGGAPRKCAWCKRALSGVEDGRGSGRSRKRVARIFGGYLCQACLRDAILRWAIRESAGSES